MVETIRGNSKYNYRFPSLTLKRISLRMVRPLPLKFLLLIIIFPAITIQAGFPQAVHQAQQHIKPDSQLINIPKEGAVSGTTAEVDTTVLKTEKVSLYL